MIAIGQKLLQIKLSALSVVNKKQYAGLMKDSHTTTARASSSIKEL